MASPANTLSASPSMSSRPESAAACTCMRGRYQHARRAARGDRLRPRRRVALSTIVCQLGDMGMPRRGWRWVGIGMVLASAHACTPPPVAPPVSPPAPPPPIYEEEIQTVEPLKLEIV